MAIGDKEIMDTARDRELFEHFKQNRKEALKEAQKYISYQEQRISDIYDFIQSHGRPYNPDKEDGFIKKDMICLYFTRSEFINFLLRIKGNLEFDYNIVNRYATTGKFRPTCPDDWQPEFDDVAAFYDLI